MAFVGGDTISVQVIHPTVGTHTFMCKADEDTNVDYGGFKADDDESSITGSGQRIKKLTRKMGSIELPPVSWEQNGVDELRILQDLMDSPEDGEWIITNISGAIYGGFGGPVGDLKGNSTTAQIPLTLNLESIKQLQ